jgi:thiol-disulfide isomerase/thioredoxin
MPAWIRRSLYAVMLLCFVIIGMRVYIEMNTTSEAVQLATGAADNTKIPEMLPEFSLHDVWGEQRAISEWAGKPLLINFWATWCAPCRREMPLFQALHSSQDDIQVLGIAIDRQPDVQTYLAEAGISYPSLVGEEDAMRVSDQFGLDGLGLPFTVLISSSSQILTIYIGELDAGQLDEMAAISRDFEKGRIDLAAARGQLEDL